MSVVRVSGLRELGDAMRQLTEEVNRRLCRQATSSGLVPIRDKARQLAPVAPPQVTPKIPYASLRDNIVIAKASKSQFTSEHLVVVRGGRKHDFASHVGALQEFGTVNMAPHAFMRPAYESEKERVIAVMQQKLREGIERAVARLGK